MNIEELIASFQKNIDLAHKRSPKVSQSNIAWQIDHSLLVFNNVCKLLIKSNPDEYKNRFHLLKSIFFKIKYFPRARVKAPKIVQSEESSITKESLKNAIDTAKSLFQRIDTLPKNSYFIHPIFGMLNVESSKKFLEIHSYHHFKIIRDILKHDKK